MAVTLGPNQPSGHLNLAAVGLTPGFVHLILVSGSDAFLLTE